MCVRAFVGEGGRGEGGRVVEGLEGVLFGWKKEVRSWFFSSSYGYSLIRRSRFLNTKLVQASSKWGDWLASNRFSDYQAVGKPGPGQEALLEISSRPRSVREDGAILLGLSVLCDGKVCHHHHLLLLLLLLLPFPPPPPPLPRSAPHAHHPLSLPQVELLKFQWFLRHHLRQRSYFLLGGDTDSFAVATSSPNLRDCARPEMLASFDRLAPSFLVDPSRPETRRQMGLFKVEAEGNSLFFLSSKVEHHYHIYTSHTHPFFLFLLSPRLPFLPASLFSPPRPASPPPPLSPNLLQSLSFHSLYSSTISWTRKVGPWRRWQIVEYQSVKTSNSFPMLPLDEPSDAVWISTAFWSVKVW